MRVRPEIAHTCAESGGGPKNVLLEIGVEGPDVARAQT